MFMIRNGVIGVEFNPNSNIRSYCDFLIEHNDNNPLPYSVIKNDGSILNFMNVDESLGYIRGFYMSKGIQLVDNVVANYDNEFLHASENIVKCDVSETLDNKLESTIGLMVVSHGVVGFVLSERCTPIYVAQFVIRANPNGTVTLKKNIVDNTTPTFKNIQEAYGYMRGYYQTLPKPYELNTQKVVADLNGREFKKAVMENVHPEPSVNEVVDMLNKVGVL